MIIKRYLVIFSLLISISSEALMLNLKNTNIRTLIGTVSMSTGKNFLIDPRVKGTINVVTSSDIDDKQLYQLFLAVMKIHGFVVIDGEDFSKILPKNLTKSDSAKQLSSVSEQIISTVVKINNVNAAKIVPIVRPLMSQYGHLAVYAASNSLIVVDSETNIVRLKNLLKKLDKSVDSDFETITLKYTSANEMSQIIKTLIIDKNLGSVLSMVVDKHNNQIVISGAEEKRLKVRLLVAELDKEQDEVSGTQVIYLSYANAKDILPTLQSIAKQTDAEIKKDKGEASKPSTISADESTNAIVITGSNETTRNVRHIIEKLDIRRAQVLIEAIIAEISLDDARELGIQWIAKGGLGVGVFNTGLIGGLAASVDNPSAILGSLPTGGTFAAGRFNSDSEGFGIILRALKGSSKANILSTPSIVTLDNEEAEIVVGQEVPFITNTTLSDSNSNPFQKIERKDVGITLKVKPQINNGSSVKLKIEQETSNVLATSSAVDVVTSKRSIKTSVMIEDKQLLVLGGLVDEVWSDGESKIPVLGDLPIVGGLFNQKNYTKTKRNLVVFIRPTILTSSVVADKISNQKYKYIKAIKLLRQGDPFFAEDSPQGIDTKTQLKLQ